MNKSMHMTIATPEGMIFEGKVDKARFPGAQGAFTVLPRHASLISILIQGKITYVQDDISMEIAIQGGFVEINNDIISVCVEVS